MLAETISLTDEEVMVILLVLLALLVAHVAVVVLGCLWAWRAGRGSQLALAGWLAILGLELLYLFGAVPGILRGEPNYYLGSALLPLTAQVALYATARSKERAGR